jgi:polyisoprenoid-binding protein YceI
MLAIYARSNLGPIRWEGTHLTGSFDAELNGSGVDTSVPPEGRLELELQRLTSGNVVYDAELMRRLETRRYPLAAAEIRFLDAVGHQNRYQAQAELTLHGVTRSIAGTVSLEVEEASVIQVYGEKVVDIRDFNIPAPTVLRLRIYPDVRVRMRLLAERESSS